MGGVGGWGWGWKAQVLSAVWYDEVPSLKTSWKTMFGARENPEVLMGSSLRFEVGVSVVTNAKLPPTPSKPTPLRPTPLFRHVFVMKRTSDVFIVDNRNLQLQLKRGIVKNY